MTDLTAAERELIARARQLTAVEAPVDLRHYLRQHGHELNAFGVHDEATGEFVYTIGCYDSLRLLGQLADLVERLDSGSTG